VRTEGYTFLEDFLKVTKNNYGTGFNYRRFQERYRSIAPGV